LTYIGPGHCVAIGQPYVSANPRALLPQTQQSPDRSQVTQNIRGKPSWADVIAPPNVHRKMTNEETVAEEKRYHCERQSDKEPPPPPTDWTCPSSTYSRN